MALLITKFAGAQSPYLCEVDSTSSGFTTTSSAARGNQLYSYLMSASGDAIDFTISSSSSHCIYVGFAIRFGTSVPTNHVIGYYDSTSGGYIGCELYMNSSGQLEFREGDSGGSTTLATTSALSADTWYYVEIAFENRNTAGDWYFYVDDVEIGSGTADGNFGAGIGVTERWRFFQGGTYNRYLTDIYCGYDNALTVDESQRLGGLTKVVYYWSTANTATSSSGVNLDIGTWSACCSNTLSPSVAAEVTGTGNARRLLDEGTDGTYTGPYDQFGTLDDCHGYKVTAMAERGGGGGSNHYIDLGGTSGYSLSQVVTLETSATYVQAYYNAGDPGIGTGAIGVGFGTDGGQDFECYNIQAAVLHAERSATARNVTCSTEVLAWDGTNHDATVQTGVSLNVSCTTEAISFTESAATVQKNQYRTITSPTGNLKKYKGLSYQTLDFRGTEYQFNGGGTIANALDADTGTYEVANYIQLGGDQFKLARGFGHNVGPVDQATELPIMVEVRAYLSNSQIVQLFAGYEDGTNLDFTGAVSDEWYDSRGLTYIGEDSSAGGWSAWFKVPVGVTNWANPHTANITAPLSWSDIQNNLCIGFGGKTTSTGRVHALQVRITSGVATLRTGYFNGTGQGSGSWTNLANAFDGSTTTWATSSGFTEDSSVYCFGNNLTQGDTTDEIFGVYIRARARMTWTATEYARIRLYLRNVSDLNELNQIDQEGPYVSNPELNTYPHYYNAPTSGSAFWTPWWSIDLDDPHWVDNGTNLLNWAGLTQLRISGNRDSSYNHPSTQLEFAKFEIAVLAAPSNTNRIGGRAKKNRGATAITQANIFTENHSKETINRARNKVSPTEVVTMAASSTVARVRGIVGATQANVLTANAATIVRPRAVTGATEALSFTESAATVSTATHRTVTCSPEALQLAEVASTINASRVTSGVTEVLSSTSAGTNVDTARGVAGTTQALAFAEQQSTVNVARGVISGTESVTISENQSVVNRERGVVGAAEALTLTESQATIGTTSNLDVTCTTEAISFTETPASVNGTRIAAGTVEITAFVENASAVNAERIVTATTETLALTDNDSTVAYGRSVAATTESISLVEGSATANRQRGVNAGTEALSLTENSANVAANRGVISATESVSFDELAANVAANRSVLTLTEALALAESAATANRQRGVNAGTEAVTMTESLSTVTRGANLDVTCTTEAISFTEATATLGLDRGVAASTEALSLTEGAASVTRSYLVTGSTEVLNLSENAATIDITANNLDVTCTTEAIAFTESQATVAFPRNVSATTEALAFAESAAGVNGQRIVGATVELTAMAESAASVNLSRTVTAVTEQLVATESAANVSTSTNRIVNATTEQVAVQQNSATSNQTRNVLSSTEVLGLTENPSSIQVVRNVVATTEVLSFAEAAASLNLTRDVIGLSAAALLVESSAQVFRGANLDVTGLTAAMTLLESAATATFPRRVDGTTEALLFTEFPALANFPKLVSALTAPLTFTEAQATISKLPASVQPGSMIWVDPGVEGAIFTDNVVIQRYD